MNPLLAIKLIGIAVAIIALGWLIHTYNEHLRESGRVEVRAQQAARDIEAVKRQDAEKRAVEAENHIKEHAAQDAQVIAAQTYQAALQRINNEKASAVAAARKLYIAAPASSCGQPSVVSAGSGSGSGANAGTGYVELPATISAAIQYTAASADADIASRNAQIAGLQAELNAYVRLCGAR